MFNIPAIEAMHDESNRVRELHGPFKAVEVMDFRVFMTSILEHCSEPFVRALKLCATPEAHPVVFYCSAGRDRTGVMAALVLAICGATDDEILADYGKSKCLVIEEGVFAALLSGSLYSGCSCGPSRCG